MSDYVLVLSDVEVTRYERMAEHAHQEEAAQWATVGIAEGARVADVGCGPGAMSTLVARLVGADGAVWAVDQDAQAVSTAEAMAAKRGLDNVHCHVGDADATGLDAGSFDVVMMRHVLAHNGGHEQAIVDHAASLLKPGGCLYLVDIDGPAMRSRPAGADMTDLSARYWDFQTARGNDMAVGLRLGELVTGAGLELVEHRGWYDIFAAPPGLRTPAWAARHAMVAAGHATEADLDRWGAYFERFDKGEVELTLFVALFSAIGRRRR